MEHVGLLPQLICYGLWLVTVFGVAELLRSRQVEAEWVRKVIHIGVGNIILLAWWLDVPQWLGVVCAVIAAGLALVSYKVNILQSLNGVGRKSFGTFFYAVSIGVLIALFWVTNLHLFAVIGILVMTWGDALAALIGQTWGYHPYQIGPIHKSWEGSLTMWVISGVVVALVLGLAQGWSDQVGRVAIVIGTLATGLEIMSWRGIDNLTVPLASGVLSYWLTQSSLLQ